MGISRSSARQPRSSPWTGAPSDRSDLHSPNVDRVRAGHHTVTVIGESGYARVRLLDEAGNVVFRTDNQGQRIETDEDGDVTIVGGQAEGDGPAARLGAGTFTIECHPQDGEPGEATLEVLPARPAH